MQTLQAHYYVRVCAAWLYPLLCVLGVSVYTQLVANTLSFYLFVPAYQTTSLGLSAIVGRAASRQCTQLTLVLLLLVLQVYFISDLKCRCTRDPETRPLGLLYSMQQPGSCLLYR